jgi:hypothetical protein
VLKPNSLCVSIYAWNRIHLLKVGALVRVSVRRVSVASACPSQHEFAPAPERTNQTPRAASRQPIPRRAESGGGGARQKNRAEGRLLRPRNHAPRFEGRGGRCLLDRSPDYIGSRHGNSEAITTTRMDAPTTAPVEVLSVLAPAWSAETGPR